MYPELVLLENIICVSLTPVFNVSYHLIAFIQLLHYQSTKCCEGIKSHPSGEGGNKRLLTVFAGEKVTNLC